MNYISLYQKYRPKSFSEVIDQKYVINILINAVKSNKIANAYIFSGPKGTGKTSIAKIFANAINCQNNINGDVCKKCTICECFNNQNLIDVIELDAASNNGVEQIRTICDNVHFLPTKLNKKIYIIDEAHMLTIGAWNALLKTIEDAPSFVVFIFATTEIYKIPETIISRCQCLKFNKICDTDLQNLLITICDKEKIKYEKQAIIDIVNIANGSARDALSILDQVSIYSANNINSECIYKVLGIINQQDAITFINNLFENKLQICLSTIKNYFQNGINFNHFIFLLIKILTNKLIYLKTNDEGCLNKINKNDLEKLKLNQEQEIFKMLNLWENIYKEKYDQNNIIDALYYEITKYCISNCKLKENNKQNQTPLFTFKERKIKDIPQSNKLENEIFDQEQILFSAFANKNKEMMEKIKIVLNQVKNRIVFENNFSIFQQSCGVICASNNCVVLGFKDKIDATLLNKNAKNKDFLLACCKFFNQPLFFVGYTINEINEKKDLLIKKRQEKIIEPEIKLLRDILNKDASIEQIAYNTIYKFIKNEK